MAVAIPGCYGAVMGKLSAAAIAAFVLTTNVRAAVVGPDAAACRAGAEPAALVRIHGFKDAVGGLRVQLYSDVADDFLVSGRKLGKVDLPITSTAPVTVCLPLPKAGRFALAVLHDRDGDQKLSIFRDGVGFSQNPKIGMGKPDLSAVLFDAGAGVVSVDVVLNYRVGFALRPLPERAE